MKNQILAVIAFCVASQVSAMDSSWLKRRTFTPEQLTAMEQSFVARAQAKHAAQLKKLNKPSAPVSWQPVLPPTQG